ncbi:MG2 domain-containing protein [Paludibaculum fermentans]|uniref:MG2 domain-containing protein n=1 Tax=Paludibaculum fermentans TaxID=1473598 RepID=UPI003EB88F32
MRSKLFAVAALFLPLLPAGAQSSVSVSEPEIRSFLKENATVVMIPVRSQVDHAVGATLVVSWIGKAEQVLRIAQTSVNIQTGQNQFEVPLPLPVSSIWLRLRYSLTPQTRDARAFPPQSGVVAIAQAANHVFEVKATYANEVHPGGTLIVQAQAVHPVSRQPLQDLEWNGVLALGREKLRPSRMERKEHGFVEFAFRLPAGAQDSGESSIEVELSAKNGDFQQGVRFSLGIPRRPSAKIQTDKPIYQPGQTVHLRAIVLDGQGRAAAGAKVSLRVEDGDDERAHTVELTASKFGIIQEDWVLPETAPLGSYTIELQSGAEETTLTRHTIRVSRYELPKFQVTVKPDRTVYLPGQTASVAITGAFLFGKPVPRGHVKVVRATSRHRRGAVEEPDSAGKPAAEGDAGDDGRFIAELDLKAELEDLQSETATRFRDLSFAAYYTDPASHRTEQSRFDIRIALEAIHIYVYQGADTGSLPRRVYVATAYADGRPAVTTVEAAIAGTTYTARTNRFGLARLQLPAATARDLGMELRARDSGGLTGRRQDTASGGRGLYSRLASKRTLHQPGDAVDILIETPTAGPPMPSVMVQAQVEGQVVASRVAAISGNQGHVRFPYQAEFRGVVTFAAWTASSRWKDIENHGIGPAQTRVIFPEGSDLQLTVKAGKAEYKPGDEASLKLQVRTADGRPVEAALGLAVVDQAVLERARTDGEFGQRPWFDCVYCFARDPLEIGGIRLDSLMNLKPPQSQDPELDLVAEALLAQANTYQPGAHGEDITERPEFESIRTLERWMEMRFSQSYAESFDFPKDDSSLNRILGVEWAAKRDPWDRPYVVGFGFWNNNRTVVLTSSGPDQRMGTEDDFVACSFRRSYFLPWHKILQSIFHPGLEFPGDEAGVRRLLSDNGILLDTLKDPWGTAYRAQVKTYGRGRAIQLRSAGPDRSFGTQDDFLADYFRGRYFLREEEAIRNAARNAATPPVSLEEFRKVLADAGVDVSQYADAWGQPFRLTSKTTGEFGDRVSLSTVQIYGRNSQLRTSIMPVTRKFIVFALRSSGPDGMPGTGDDFDMVSVRILLDEESAAPSKEPQLTPAARIRDGGEVAGMVLDQTGAAILNAQVVLILQNGRSYVTQSDASGAYSVPAVMPGLCAVHASAPGFMGNLVEAVPVTKGKVTQVDITLRVGSVSETVNVSAEATLLQTSSASVALPLAAQPVLFTPRVRTYFPETLYWVPELTTDQQGLASIQFPLADSVTTWKIAAIASTLDGRQVEAESDLRVFQPFFLDFDPPLVLTQGDRVRMPVAVRNYLDRALPVDLVLEANDWSRFQGKGKLELTIPPNTTDQQHFDIEAKVARKKAAQRITARGGQLGDAIERTTEVHPDGQAVSQVMGDFVAGRTAFGVNIPATAIVGATSSELRLYPNVLSILSEGAAALLVTPHGCAEQTTSAGFANLIALRYARAAGMATPAFEAVALKNIRLAVDGLRAYRGADGGISYWGGGNGDPALAAYVVEFLLAAQPLLKLDTERTEELVRWLESVQSKNGLWDRGLEAGLVQERRAVLITAQVARSLAAAKRAGIQLKPTTLAGAYHHMARLTDSLDDPYPLAQFVLAALDSGDEELLGKAGERLMRLARPESTALYWDLQTNSPFAGWGSSGRAETTGLVLSALREWRTRHPETPGIDTAIRRGLLFLLRKRDAQGSWNSTQATVRAMRAVAEASSVLGRVSEPGGSIGIRVNGRLVHTVQLPAELKTTDPILVDMSPFLANGHNQVELTPQNGSGNVLLRMASTHWIPWEKTKPRASPDLRLAVAFDKLRTRAGEPIRCTVKAERVGFRGYGMMLAEIGLPPGAEVDRSSLEKLVEDDDSGLQRYEVQPDRVILYLWPLAGGVSLAFEFSGRLSMQAKAAASSLYDYYNPEALAEVEPARFLVY